MPFWLCNKSRRIYEVSLIYSKILRFCFEGNYISKPSIGSFFMGISHRSNHKKVSYLRVAVKTLRCLSCPSRGSNPVRKVCHWPSGHDHFDCWSWRACWTAYHAKIWKYDSRPFSCSRFTCTHAHGKTDDLYCV